MVVSENYPYLQVQFNVRGYEDKLKAYIDTGFDGYLIIPADYIAQLGKGDYISRWELGDSSTISANDYIGTVFIQDIDTPIIARITCLANETLLGRGIIDKFRVTFNRGQSIEIEV